MRALRLFAKPAWPVLFSLLVLGGARCTVYDEGVLGGSGGEASEDRTASGTGKAATTGGGGEGGAVGCVTPGECPGDDGECGTRTCEDGVCGLVASDVGTPTQTQTLGDCKRLVCDGHGGVMAEVDDSDVENDARTCTRDTCVGGQPQHDPEAPLTGCADDGGVVCNAAGACVACVDGSQCASNVCSDTFTCSPASCGDGSINGEETDLNCGGSVCPKCAIGQTCSAGTDCLSGVCGGTQCQPSCADGLVNQDETDVDCGGTCAPCAFEQGCDLDEDCTTGNCAGTTCGPVTLLLSEVRTRGPNAGNDELIEIYNPGNLPVTLTSDIVVVARSKQGQSYVDKWMAGGQVLPARGHLLVAGATYAGGVAADATLAANNGIADESSIVMKQGDAVIDAVCFYCGATGFDASYTCEGTAFVKTGCTSNLDRSLERKPGAGAGNGQDTGDSATDWQVVTPSNPQNLASPPTP